MHTKHFITSWLFLGAGFNEKTLGEVFVCERERKK